MINIYFYFLEAIAYIIIDHFIQDKGLFISYHAETYSFNYNFFNVTNYSIFTFKPFFLTS